MNAVSHLFLFPALTQSLLLGWVLGCLIALSEAGLSLGDQPPALGVVSYFPS